MSDKSLTQSCVLQRQEVNPDCCQIDQYLNKTQFFFILQKRLQKELVSLIKEPPPGVVIDGESVGQSLDL